MQKLLHNTPSSNTHFVHVHVHIRTSKDTSNVQYTYARASESLRHQIRRYLVDRFVSDALLLAFGRERHNRRRLHKRHRQRADALTLQHNQVTVLTQEAILLTHQHRPVLVERLEVLALVRLDQRHYLAGGDRKLLVARLDVLGAIVANDLHLGRVTAARLRQVVGVLVPAHSDDRCAV